MKLNDELYSVVITYIAKNYDLFVRLHSEHSSLLGARRAADSYNAEPDESILIYHYDSLVYAKY